jgi:hypothetical protein
MGAVTNSQLLSGRELGYPYSFSRYTEVPAGKWEWFQETLQAGRMSGTEPLHGISKMWSLRPEDTLGLVFWTKDPTNLVKGRDLLAGYRVRVHVTVTGWEEAEEGAPGIWEGSLLLQSAVRCFGAERVTWRFSPVPLVPNVVERFEFILKRAAAAQVSSVYLSFLQPNDLVPEVRSSAERISILSRMATKAQRLGVRVLLCNEDKLLLGKPELHPNLRPGVCAPPSDFALPGRGLPPYEGCGCILMVDHFTVNEACDYKCTYCYAGDQSLSPEKRDTTRKLPVVP